MSLVGWFKKISEANENILSMNRRNVEYIKVFNKRRDYPLADNKILAKAFFKQIEVATAPTLLVLENLFEVTNFHSRFDHEEFVIKPACGSQGKGILVIKAKTKTGFLKANGIEMSASQVEHELASILFGKYSIGRKDSVLIEQRLTPAPEFSSISVGGLFDIRVIVADGLTVAAMLRLPTVKSGGKANLHQGGIGAGVDMVSGRVISAFCGGKKVTHHPDTSTEIIGFQVPYWADVIKVAKLIGKHSPLKYVGVDLTIDDKIGISVLEFNARPGLGIQNANQKGLLELMREAMNK